ncbi:MULTISPECIES: dipeptidase [unclassified Rhodococcus (in: high G+C Gram-positive bacteria)]|uniref:dipeptidase n=1 Tax=unclassified Rhodococcus (in: high G+C Gram-positive bacteria) TaxID=192944 RepID=UPI0006FEB9EF|nr:MULTISPECIES: dipeptidase [unclassified Rhodococcus (in: high G+C Gram-positive bacteria)]KQU29386.1 beta-Ala-His dipeptidase [Rhodococcus sp. Leaf225]KQU41152.1 beta-Ala-His dipeptidase [Rhodococcus sp. Leaf258]MDQ1179448.1 acetylornithine deacetylase/succinyl-diaminopimelate desuccinylase-like protein [Rhodococcus sp. SORGH_AS_0301]
MTSGTDAQLSELRDRVRASMPRVRAELADLVAFRSIADPEQAPPSECRSAAEWVRDAFRDAGVKDTELHETSDGSAAVIGRRRAADGAPTVLLYSHYDVQPAGDESLWNSAPFELTDRDGRWFGRGSADCKGNVLMHLAALRALGSDSEVGIVVVCEGSEETGTGGLEDLVHDRPELFAADVIVIGDTGNIAVGTPTLTTSLRGMAIVRVDVETLRGAVHSGMYGGPAPDALVALVAMLATLHDVNGDTTIDGVDGSGVWGGAEYPVERFRTDAGVLDGVELTGSGSIADHLWARPSVTVMGIDCPPVVGSAAAVVPRASARIGLRVPPGMDAEKTRDLLVTHLTNAAPWSARVTVTPDAVGSPFAARTDGPAYGTLMTALSDAYGEPVQFAGQGGSIPLCTALQRAVPDAEIVLMGVEEPLSTIHAPNESVDPSEIETIAVAEAAFLSRLPEQWRLRASDRG